MAKKSTIPKGEDLARQMESDYHIPVLLKESVDALGIVPDGIYVDCTFGGGGHSRAILAKLGPAGKLVAFDQDAAAQNNLPDDPRIIFVPHNFRHLQRFLRLHRIENVDGVLADLGVSSHQFDEADRGFSIRFDADLDMRMDQRGTLKAADIIASYSEQELHKLFEQYGEVTNAKTLARTIVELRNKLPMRTISQFKAALQGVVKGNPNKYFAQVFQALRIAVNDELGALKEMLQQLPQVLKPGGRAAIITFHSLEDRLVKVFFKSGSFDIVDDHPFENRVVVTPMAVISKKPVVPTEQEMKKNPRARSAKLRVAERR
ncbi:16S rRNA (cytosine(1402)-N(4))-methyltransferase RsmH [Flavihumibacter profundi]|uniref:16S rRNA (cytosine(1402)-N(4))-methyltransferase RsmH n=1 Tax=Flavihumibacter profundi TaxID=2716883 RepID=UPI001CC6E523|nr:16S rRNA (cytosine(1402)-N(4))-methyltransferase RsmH [Flavihumibacter profundi]MBZ5858228.1 16S rRNA (cytosine(1402)-N(4))-methyltransferase RsmH [Flavihumibacter profundi]